MFAADRGDFCDRFRGKVITADGVFHDSSKLKKVWDEQLKCEVFELDGREALALRHGGLKAQTIYVLVRFAEIPGGILISRHRPEKGMRGMELFFTGENLEAVDGPKLAVRVSNGEAWGDRGLFDEEAVKFPQDRYLMVVLRFLPEKLIRADVYDAVSGAHLRGLEHGIDFLELAKNAGQGWVCIGGRRKHSKCAEFFVPSGTRIADVTILDRFLPDTELSERFHLQAASRITRREVIPTIEEKSPIKPVLPKAFKTLHVDGARGSDTNDGLTAERPLRTIQAAVDQINPGDTVVVADGIYFETPQLNRPGLPDYPVIIRTRKPGISRVIISAADRDIREHRGRWKLEDGQHHIYSIAFPHQPARILVDGLDLFAGPPSLECLKKSRMLNDYPAPLHGYFFDASARRLYVRLHPDLNPDPARHTIAVGPGYPPGFNGSHISRPEHCNVFINAGAQAHVILDGFTFETPGGAGVLTKSGQVVVRNATFLGCRFALWGIKSRGVFIENCLYTQNPVFLDYLDILARFRNQPEVKKFRRFYYWAHKGKHSNLHSFKNYETGVMGGSITGGHIRNSIIDNTFEGNSCWCDAGLNQICIYGNRYSRIVDNAIECENHIRDIRIHDNLFEDIFEPISWQPLSGLPWPSKIRIYRNVVRDSDAFKIRSTWHQGIFKIGASDGNWRHPHTHMQNVPDDYVEVPGGFFAFNNTLLRPDFVGFTTPQPKRRQLRNFHFVNNIFHVGATDDQKRWNYPQMKFSHNAEIVTRPNAPVRGILAGDGGFETRDFSILKVPADGIGTPGAGSPLTGSGGAVPHEIDFSEDIGAFPHDGVSPGADWPGKKISCSDGDLDVV